ncbi:hypothetical protein [Salinisphaera sp. G21_0]|uniref:hypothetical protein n=1 Tax=Salinisphaera sp. G21_0 TaxID=2821094 RepID=UPI001ADB4D25|nr:hypothetical protein [Salinisphaera sp. G21_0]MBO9484398.1 hypothetical protein [Salinisphaera sp. G21_0]
MKAYDDERLNSLFAEDDKPDLKNLIKSLAMAVPHFARAKGIDPELGGYGVIGSLLTVCKNQSCLKISRIPWRSPDTTTAVSFSYCLEKFYG